jgi:hypothetical protein
MVEQWNIGYQKRMMVRFIFWVSANPIETDLIPPNAGFQYSNTPVFQYPMGFIHGTANLI